MQDVVDIRTAECTGKKHLLYFNKVHRMIQGSQKEHSHVSWTEQGRNLGGSVGWNIGKTKRTKRTISTIRMMEQGQVTWRGFGPSCSGKSGSTGCTGMDPGRTRKGRKRNFCLEIHQQGFISVTERNTPGVWDGMWPLVSSSSSSC